MKQKTGMALLLSVVLALTGCGSTAVQPQKNKEGVTDAPTQTEQVTEDAETTGPELTTATPKGTERYLFTGGYIQMDKNIKPESGTRCLRNGGGTVGIYNPVTEKKYVVNNEMYSHKLHTKKVHIKKSLCLYDVYASSVTTMVIDGNVELADDNIVCDVDGEPVIAEYDSWFHGCPLVKNIVIKGGTYSHNKKNWEDDPDELTNRTKFVGGRLFVKNKMLMYAYPHKGIMGCPMSVEGKPEIPDDTKEIYSCAFQKCRKITDICIPSTVKQIGDAAFGYNEKLKAIEVSAANKYFKSEDGVLYSKDGKTLVAYPAGKKDVEFHIPVGVRKIQAGAFMGAASLKKIYLPDTVSYIGEKAFMDCVELTGIICEKKVRQIVRTAFINCSNITTWPKRQRLI